MGYIEVDQSGKIEQFDRDTVVALCNDRSYSVLLPKKVKQEVFIRHKKEVSNLKYKLFSIALFYCARGFLDENRLTVICSEYERKEAIIKAFLLDLLNDNGFEPNNSMLRFGIITKKSPAHKLALSVFRGLKEPDVKLSAEHIKPLLR